ncbi:MAG: inositol monophosphatase [Sneathiellaceae bacterium]
MTLPDPARVAAQIRSIGEEIALHHFRQLEPGQVSQKTGPSDLVTVADLAVEKALTAWLLDAYPDTVVLGEEAFAADPSRIDLLQGDQPVWVIDPIDGTINFASGVPMFATILAYVVGGETRMGWIHDPVQDLMALAEQGAGATLLAGGSERRPARTGTPPALSHMTGCINLRNHGDRAAVASLAEASDRYGTQLILRCSGAEYLAAVQGQIDFAAYGSMYPWDHAAGCLIVAEAGGYAARLDGPAYRPTMPARQHWPLLVAHSRAGWETVRSDLFGAAWLSEADTAGQPPAPHARVPA